ALAFYAGEGVAPACLALQDEASVDVIVLILAVFAAVERGVVLSDSGLREADRLVAGWRKEIVHPLRGVRRTLKSGPDPAPSAQTEALRNRIKKAELDAEQVELAMLYEWLAGRTPGTAGPEEAERVPGRVAAYFHGRGGAGEMASLAGPIDTLSRAARRLAEDSTSEGTSE
ncbi:MAG: TIGR02444 family protein, partial [Flavobacteriaceae bacterium]